MVRRVGVEPYLIAIKSRVPDPIGYRRITWQFRFCLRDELCQTGGGPGRG